MDNINKNRKQEEMSDVDKYCKGLEKRRKKCSCAIINDDGKVTCLNSYGCHVFGDDFTW